MKKTIYIDGLSCQNCVRHVEKALKKIPHVVSVEVILKKRLAYVELNGEVDSQQLMEAINEIGYEVIKVE